MLFNTAKFLFFFIVVWVVYWQIRQHRLRLIWLTAASVFFYMSAKPVYILLILGSTSIDYFVSLQLERTANQRTRQWLLALSVSANLSILGFFKYALFFTNTFGLTPTLTSWGVKLPGVELLPLGISFYTFEAISYIVDVYYGRIRAVRNPLDYAVYILFFPHLVAGPIVRPHDFLPQLDRPKWLDWVRVQAGVRLFMIGLFKKAVIADQIALIIDPVYKNPEQYNSGALWLAMLGYAMQIYCDFSGYTDMALGIAHTFGFKLPNNFNAPYLASSPADFWRRWHISLSRWLRDYLYISLGGNRLGPTRTMVNLFLTMLLGGLWHGANWTFIVWGAYHGLLLALQRLIPNSWNHPALRPFTIMLTFLLVCIGWVFFRAQTLSEAYTILRGLVIPTSGQGLTSDQQLIVLAGLAAVFTGHLLGQYRWRPRSAFNVPAPIAGLAIAGLLLLALLLMPSDGKVFIYFQF
jgi:alginate O-acetyltransferase complex protein AlgI